MFRDQLDADRYPIDDIERICIFAAKCFVKYWMQSDNSIYAPKNDLDFFKAVRAFGDETISKIVIDSMDNQLYYLNELVWLALFDDRIDEATKERMVVNLSEKENDDQLLTLDTTIDELFNRDVLSSILNLERDFEFLQHEVSEWPELADYQNWKALFSSLEVTNDFCERVCKLTKDYDNLKKKNNVNNNLVHHMVSSDRSKRPAATKRCYEK